MTITETAMEEMGLSGQDDHQSVVKQQPALHVE
jgi:hypothetical protein